MTPIIRYALAAVAALACGWFAVGVRQARDTNTATALLNNAGTERSASVQKRERSLLNAAAFLNPGVDVTLLRAQLAENARDYVRAKRLIDQATAAEPDNLEAWLADLKLGFLDRSVANGKLVFVRLHQLDPVDVYTH